MTQLHETLKRCVDWLDRYDRPGQRVGEQNTKAAVIEPVLAALGWSVFDLDEVQREYRRRSTDNPVDYALLLLRKPRLFVEAKGIGENLDDPRWANQTIGYATGAGVEWVALTNGAEWRIYNAHAPVPIEEKLFRAVRLRDDIDVAFEVLSLLSKEGMRDNRIEELWRSYFVDRQVYAALMELFNTGDPARELVNLMVKRVPNLGRGDVRDSLMRARASFNFPSAGTLAGGERLAVPTEPLPSVPPAPPVTTPQPSALKESGERPRQGRERVTPDQRRTSLRDVLASGRLRVGDKCVTDYRGCGHTAELLSDGSVRYAGQVYRSLSAAGEAVKVTLLGSSIPDTLRATDGWAFWRATDVLTGDNVTMKELRARTAGA